MPLLAKFIGAVATFFLGIFGRFLGYKAALKLASFLSWVAVLGTFITTVSVCLSSLHGMVSSGVSGGSAWLLYFAMGLGMFIPSNAVAVLSCMSSVWIGAQVYKIRKSGIQHYSH